MVPLNVVIGGAGSRLGVCGANNAEGTGNIVYPGCVTRTGSGPQDGKAAAYASGAASGPQRGAGPGA